MLPRYRNALIALLILFGLAFAGLVGFFYDQAHDYAIGEARKQALNALLVHRATHAYVTKVQRPEIYRLKAEGKLYEGYFSPEVMSFTFISRNIHSLLNQEREKHGLEQIYFKLAAENARNPVNRADAAEAALLGLMNRDAELKEHQEVLDLGGRPWLYLAVPIERSSPGCMKCHGDPKDAPQELLAMYGDKAGFHETPSSIRALISIRVPLDGITQAGNRLAGGLTLVTFLVLTGIYVSIAFLIRRIDGQQQRILRQNAELEDLSVTDALTGVLNRLGLMHRSDEVIARAHRFSHPLALLLIDLDHFKQVNDLHGHPVGDEVLKRFVAIIQSNLRVSDIFGRWGGEEFLVISPHLLLNDALKLAEKLRKAIEEADFPAAIRLTTCIGVSEYRSGERVAELIGRADRALYQAKGLGRNRVVGESGATD